MEIVLTVLMALIVLPRVILSSPSWIAIVVGFLAFAIGLGPAANTTVGARVGEWFHRIGYAGRTLCIVFFAVTAVVAFQVESIPNELLGDVGVGGLAACLVFILVHLAHAGEVAGWTPSRE